MWSIFPKNTSALYSSNNKKVTNEQIIFFRYSEEYVLIMPDEIGSRSTTAKNFLAIW